MMEHLHTKTCFINETLYTTSSGLVTSSFTDMIEQLRKKSDTNNTVTVLCDILPVSEILTLYKTYNIKSDFHNALFTYYPYPIDMIDEYTLHLCIASFENAPQKIHQISFKDKDTYFRFGISI